jgi:hypothetical protein
MTIQRKTIQLVHRSGGGIFKVPRDHDRPLGRLDQIQRASSGRPEEGPPETRPEYLFEDIPEITHSAELQVLKALKPCIVMLIDMD